MQFESSPKFNILYEGFYDDDRVFFPFPDHLLPREQDKQAALTFLACGEAIAYMHELFRIMLKGWSAIAHSPTPFIIHRPTHKRKGTCIHIVEIPIKVRPPERLLKMIRPIPDNYDYWHEIIHVTLKSGEEYVIVSASFATSGPYTWSNTHNAYGG